ncbi:MULTISPECIES: nicotinate-nucleotide--dimethylbenzimidazole phosphoribosyltransferase [Thermocrispum]|jgi:nicotinate-nucleotide--dimethylbenzimidazole phosphoribosyltransferase|uniref:Nicotinate-nucleotide--dimethylbenzimidazole phosphoribosyltransferase n=1 Tax=Thermocrispum agreste TaxID=37925 RepID=A0ABD6FH79_9PSEU|nr:MULTISPECIES: nicotinate-nucleotide--dimethylbenzimidazole phosphoribosyltransferase [Thermocrispum]
MTSATVLELPRIEPPDGSARTAALSLAGADDTVATPAGPLGLGKLATVASWLAGCQGTCPPRRLRTPRVVVFAAEHGITERGVSSHGADAAGKLVAEINVGGGAVGALAQAANAGTRVVEMEPAARPIDTADAMTAEEAESAVRKGMEMADAEVDGGADLLVASSVGAGATTPAAVLIGTLTDTEPVAVVGRGSGIDDTAWMRKTSAIRDAMRRAKPRLSQPMELLAAAGGADLAGLTGFLIQAAVRRTPVLLGGVTVLAAAVVAEELAPGARDWWLAASSTTEPAHAVALQHLDLEPLLDLRLGGDAPTAGLLALPLVTAAAWLLADA